ncbi:MAG: hypothetical protein EVJ48_01190 [Candidatus Acidulodesulfobacterium acidiphilum]|uniref:Uncharacterized protein n=1 Tax=Candidatus Acidulodesulfobacterium acidiphilum TaxID=2597224 RepID=A0A520XH88_9DELT|nr:MAG: hypothetical protein EVJ48_01190 [Candidatus Acidulodesulfobacterium acidiphilum]
MKEKTKEKFPLKIIKDKLTGRYKAATSIDKLNDETKNIRRELSFIETDYTILLGDIRGLLSEATMRSKKKADPRLYWLIGENIIRFIERLNDLGFYLLKQNITFAADIGMSESSIGKIISFRKRFSKISMLDQKISWSKYRDNKALTNL